MWDGCRELGGPWELCPRNATCSWRRSGPERGGCYLLNAPRRTGVNLSRPKLYGILQYRLSILACWKGADNALLLLLVAFAA